MDCFKIVAGIEPLEEDFLIFRFKISFLTSSIVTVSKSKSSPLIFGKCYLIFLMLLLSSNSETMLFKYFVVHFLEDFKSNFLGMLMKKLIIIVAISFSFTLIKLFSNKMNFSEFE